MLSKNNPSHADRGLSPAQVTQLRDSISGRVILPGDAEYDQARTPFYGGFDRRPSAIFRVVDASDISRVISLARESGQELAVRGGGHSPAAQSISDGGLVINLSQMRDLQIDPDACTAWAEAGLTAAEYTSAAEAHGLATGFGDTGSVGIGGITLAGGVGYLVRKYGLTIDSLLGAEIVTADGELLQADAEHNPDLFWAIRGGGGNFGVATRFKFRLHRLGPVMGGLLILPATSEVIAGFIAGAEAAPEQLSTIANIMVAPPMPFLPKEVHGKLIVMAMLVHVGDAAAGEVALRPFRQLATPLADMLKPMRYSEVYPPEDPSYRPIAAARTMFMDHIDRSVAETILDYLRKGRGSLAVAQLRVLGGAMARVPADATAFAHRTSHIMANVATLYEQLETRPIHEAWASEFAEELQQEDTGAYVGFLGEEGQERVRAAYPPKTWERLAAIKARYDPANLFRLNQNVPPAQ